MSDISRRDETPDFERMTDEELDQKIIEIEETIAGISDQLSDDLQGIGDRDREWSRRASSVRNHNRRYLRFGLREKAARVEDLERIEKETLKRDEAITRQETLAIERARKEAAVAEREAAAAWADARRVEAGLPKVKKKVGV